MARASPIQIRRERCTIIEAVGIVGVSARTVQSLAARGKIPGAAKLAGTRKWTFDLEALRRWVKDEERKQWENSARLPRGVIGVAKPYGGGSRLRVRSTSGAFEQAMQRLLGGSGKKARQST